MRRPEIDYTSEFEKLRNAEFGEPLEPYPRLVAVALAGGLIYTHTGSPLSLIWPAWFLTTFAVYILFVTRVQAPNTRRQAMIAAVLMINVQVGFGWYPSFLFSGEDRPLMLVGGCLLCTQLIFLNRRSDTLSVLNKSHVALVFLLAASAYYGFSSDFHTPLAYIGTALAALAVIYYFHQTQLMTRRIRRNWEEAAGKVHQSQKMAAIGQLAGGVAHDFNNNLTAIIGSLELMQASGHRAEDRVDIDTALTAARQAAHTVKQLMIFARVDKPVITDVPVHSLFDELERLTLRLIPTSVQFVLNRPAEGLTVKADQHQLLSGLINLIVNAVDAMPSGGEVLLDAKRVISAEPLRLSEETELPAGSYIQITVKDTGEGIPKHLIDRVREPFFTTKPVNKGTGLGLSMVVGLVDEMNGAMTIASRTSANRTGDGLGQLTGARWLGGRGLSTRRDRTKTDPWSTEISLYLRGS